MLSAQCGRCLFWKRDKEEGAIHGDCYRATHTTDNSGCGAGFPVEQAELMSEAITKALLSNDEVLDKIAAALSKRKKPRTRKPAPRAVAAPPDTGDANGTLES